MLVMGGGVVKIVNNLMYDANVDNDVTADPGVQACQGK